MTSKYDVAGIGNALVDIIAPAEEAFLVERRAGEGRHDAGRRGARGVAV
jgi:hypothetical protein